jgi:DNA (cytosine-5)-methyltransferase 1
MRLVRSETGQSARERLDIDCAPRPTIMAGGLGGGNRSQYWLEDDGMKSIAKPIDKPPYRVPSMAEIAVIPWNGFNVVSTFSGCGGSCLGYRMAGFRVLWANEFVKAAQVTYRANHPDSILDTRDIRSIRPSDILSATKLGVGDIDVFDGSPPCASFSTAGKREAGWGQAKKYSDTKQRTDDLFFEFARLVKGLRPKTFVAENVSGLVKGVAKGYFLDVLAALKACGYRVTAKLLDAQWLGVPQARQRLIFVGVRNDLGIEPAHPSPLSYRYSVRDAIPWIRRVAVANNVYAEASTVQASTVQALTGRRMSTSFATEALGYVEAEADISRFAIGNEWDNLRPGGKSDKYINLVKPSIDRPCNTVTAPSGLHSAATVVHPIEKRRFSIAELKRICAFPDDFVLLGSYAQQWERLGRAVPPVMMRAIAEVIRDQILCRLPN